MDNLWEIAQKRGKQLGKSTRGWFSQPGSMFNRSKGNGEVKEPEECIVKNGDRFIEFLAGEHCKLIPSVVIILVLIRA